MVDAVLFPPLIGQHYCQTMTQDVVETNHLLNMISHALALGKCEGLESKHG